MDDYRIRVEVAPLESCLTSKESRAVRRGAVGKVPAQVTRWPPTLLHVRFLGGGEAAMPLLPDYSRALTDPPEGAGGRVAARPLDAPEDDRCPDGPVWGLSSGCP